MALVGASGIAAETMKNYIPNALMASELLLAEAEAERA